MDSLIAPIREKRAYYEAHPEIIKKIIDAGAERFRNEAKEVILGAKVKDEDIGLRRIVVVLQKNPLRLV